MTQVRSNPRNATKAKSRGARTYDLEVVGQLERVTAPKQTRSELSLQRVLAALESLLEQKAFGAISIPEIASLSECGVATIYGRFKDKDSILVALHESARASMVAAVDAWLDAKLWVGRSLEELTQSYCESAVAYYKRHRNLLAASLTVGDREVYERAAATIQHIAIRFAEAVRATRDGGDAKALERNIDLGVRAVFALLQQRSLFGSVPLSQQSPQSDAAFAAELASMLRMFARQQD